MATSEYIYNEEKKLNNTIIRYQSSMNGKNYNLIFTYINFLFNLLH